MRRLSCQWLSIFAHFLTFKSIPSELCCLKGRRCCEKQMQPSLFMRQCLKKGHCLWKNKSSHTTGRKKCIQWLCFVAIILNLGICITSSCVSCWSSEVVNAGIKCWLTAEHWLDWKCHKMNTWHVSLQIDLQVNSTLILLFPHLWQGSCSQSCSHFSQTVHHYKKEKVSIFYV